MTNNKFPYIQTFEMEDTKFKYWVTDEQYEDLYQPAKWKTWILTEEYKKFIKKGDKILEIGSGNGFTTCLFKSMTGTEGLVVGIELVPNNCLIANSVIALNNFDKCHILNFAAYQKNGQENYLNRNNGKLTYAESEETNKIDTLECDKLIKDYGFFDVIILDVNGFELNVLKGCTELLTNKPKIILNLFEFETPFGTSNYNEILDILNAEEYKGLVYIYNENKIIDFEIDSLVKTKPGSRVLLSPLLNTNESNSNLDTEIINQENLVREEFTSLFLKNEKYYTESDKLWMKYYINLPFSKKRRKGNIALFHLGRCGSSVLAFMLKSNPDIFWDGENIGDFYLKKLESEEMHDHVNHLSNIVADVEELKMTNDPITFLKIRMYWTLKNYYGFETKFSRHEHLREEILNMPLNEYIKLLSGIGFKDFIVLKRENYLKQVLSYHIAEKTKIYHSTKEKTSPDSVYLNINNCWIGNKEIPLLDIFEEMDNDYEELNNLLYGKKHLHLTYEKDIQEDPVVAYKKVCDFLNVDYHSPKIVHKRTNPFKIKEIVENYEELKEYLNYTKYSWMVEQ